jgi:hypothetical protein
MCLVACVGVAVGYLTPSVSSGASGSSESTSTGTPTSSTTTVTLTGTAKVKLDFGYSRDAKPVHLDYGTAGKLDSSRAFDLHPSDLHNGGDTLSSDSLSWTKTLLDSHHATFKIVVDPKGVQAGIYDGALGIVGDNVQAKPVTLSVSFSQHGDGARALLFVLIVAAALLGLGLKWLASAGTKLQRAEQRLVVLDQRLRPYDREAIPAEYLASLAAVEQLIRNRDAGTADTQLTELENGLPKVISVARWFAWVEGIVSAAQTLIRDDPRLADDRAALNLTPQEASSDARRIKDDSWPDPDGQASPREAFAPLESYLPFLERFAAADAAARVQPPFPTALGLYQTGQYEAARNSWTAADEHPPQPITSNLFRGQAKLRNNLDGNIHLVAADGPVADGGGRGAVGWLIEHAAVIAAIAGGILAASVIVGTVAPTFHGLGDWAKFAAAGFAAGLTGATLSDFAAKKTTTQ